MHPALHAAQVLREAAPRQNHERRRACLTVADHLDSAVREVEASTTGLYYDIEDSGRCFVDGIEQDFNERSEVVR